MGASIWVGSPRPQASGPHHACAVNAFDQGVTVSHLRVRGWCMGFRVQFVCHAPHAAAPQPSVLCSFPQPCACSVLACTSHQIKAFDAKVTAGSPGRAGSRGPGVICVYTGDYTGAPWHGVMCGDGERYDDDDDATTTPVHNMKSGCWCLSAIIRVALLAPEICTCACIDTPFNQQHPPW